MNSNGDTLTSISNQDIIKKKHVNNDDNNRQDDIITNNNHNTTNNNNNDNEGNDNNNDFKRTMANIKKFKQIAQSPNIEPRIRHNIMKEIEEEENLMIQLRYQHEKIELIRAELNSKDKYYSEIMEENEKLRKEVYTAKNYEDMYYEAKNEIQDQQYLIEKYVDEIKIINESNAKLIEELKFWRSECEILQKSQRESIDQISNLKKMINEEINKNRDQYSMFINMENEYKEIIQNVKNDMLKIEEDNQHYKMLIINLENEIKKKLQNHTLDINKLEQAEKYNDELMRKLAQQTKENDQVLFEYQTNIDNLKKELELREEALVNQDKCIENLKENNDQMIILLKQNVGDLEKKLEKNNNAKKILSKECKNLISKIKDMDKEIKLYVQENIQLKQELKSSLLQQEMEQKYRDEIEKVKHDILSTRNSEVQKLTEAFDEIFPEILANSNSDLKESPLSENLARSFFSYRTSSDPKKLGKTDRQNRSLQILPHTKKFSNG